MSGLICNGRSDGLHALYEWLNQARESAGRSQAPAFKEVLANRELAAYFQGQASRGPARWAEGLFPPAPEQGLTAFEPFERMLRDEEKDACIEAAAGCIRRGACIYGPETEALAGHLGDFLDVGHVILCASGTAALTVSLLALGVGPGDEVIIPANSFAATENAVLATQAKPVLAEVREDTHNLAPESVEQAITPRTKVILPVDLYGGLADLEALRDIADQRGLSLLEDACQAIGASGAGKKAHLATLSFNTYKNFAGCGKAGAVLTDDGELAAKAARISYHGFEPGQKMVKHLPFGFNCMIDNLQAATLLARLPYLSLINFRRLCLASRYNEALQEPARAGILALPKGGPGHSWHQYTVTLPNSQARDGLESFMEARGLPTEIIYSRLSHQQETPLRQTVYKGVRLPVTESLHQRKLSLPIFNGMSLEEQDRIIEAVREFRHSPLFRRAVA
ncbi:MAG: DegT/DnrJ/EryC1/StrS family aminotransferase [Desulfarculaceae bacterium]|nr:DegT/DnrJ/EryC1/StrS family aminotransferase [Desulfarculaceae bacterium]MCF8073196.1 DegT/DnrJ/EryC1/StrS family aminotransferase [Desulfarculaceae bacterium]MCF8100792.1 DegT/DnrJ/EryC1/StrS family aminotransferase [Desulfarculaceae bacterium]MCF8118439.1 DegT/DnrJ/EryC1/StrS family aminotransferase [Desulfarculaceae bacterium]